MNDLDDLPLYLSKNCLHSHCYDLIFSSHSMTKLTPAVLPRIVKSLLQVGVYRQSLQDFMVLRLQNFNVKSSKLCIICSGLPLSFFNTILSEGGETILAN